MFFGKYRPLKPSIESKVEKVYDFKKGGRYLLVVSTDKYLNEKEASWVREMLEFENAEIMRKLGILSAILLLDNNMKLNII